MSKPKLCIFQMEAASGGNLSRTILEAIKERNLGRYLDVSGRRGFKLSTMALHMFPAEISSKLMHLKKVSTTFDGKRGQKVFFENKNYQLHKISKFYRLCFYKLMRMTAILSMSSGSL